jgi:hypothetical protein
MQTRITEVQARQAETVGVVRYVLAASLSLAVISMAVVFFSAGGQVV